jgi:hypothetical protein
MKTNSKNGKVTFELLKPERHRIEAAVAEIATMMEYTRLQEKASEACQAIRELLAEFEPENVVDG